MAKSGKTTTRGTRTTRTLSTAKKPAKAALKPAPRAAAGKPAAPAPLRGASARAAKPAAKTAAAKAGTGRVRLPKPAPRAAAKPVAPAPAKPAAAASPAPRSGLAPGSPWMIPTLVVRTAEAAISFYERAFGFVVDFTMPGPTGAIAYAQLRHAGGLLHLSPEGAYGTATKAPVTSRAECPVTIYVYCADVDALVARARTAGASILSEPADMFWGDRMASLADPEGYRWAFATHVAPFDPTRPPPADYPNGKGG